MGDVGKGDVHQFVVAGLVHPTGETRHVAVGAGVGRAATQQNDAGGARVGHGHVPHQAVEPALDDGEDLAAQPQVWRAGELDRRMADARGGDGGRDILLDVAGGVENEWQHHHPPTVGGGTVEPRVERGFGQFDEAQFDAPVR